MNNVRRLATTGLVVTLGFVPAVLAISVYAAIGVLAGIAGALSFALELLHTGTAELVKRLPLDRVRSA